MEETNETTVSTKSKGNGKVLLIIWIISAIIVTAVYLPSNPIEASSIAYYISGLIGAFLAIIAPGCIIGLVVLLFTWIIKRNFDKAISASIFAAIIVNFLMLYIKL